MRRVILYSRDVNLRPLLSSALGRGYEVVCTSRTEMFLEMVHSGQNDLLLLDIATDGLGRDEYLRMCRTAVEQGISVVAMVDDTTRPLALQLIEAGAHGYCTNPPALRELKTALERAAEFAAMKRQLDSRKAAVAVPPAPVHGLVGSSPAMRHVRNLIERVANLNASVLVTGESGTGKELVARAIHNSGSRKDQPFLAVSCGAIPETLIESELFGHEKGAFTGSTGTHCGYFEQAGAGTLFLDEIGELSPQTQVKLLRIIQQREFSRLGSARVIPLKARLIFATHRNLSKMVADGLFRLDLFYRINVMTIHSPSLSQRTEDIPDLCCHFLHKYSEMYEKYFDGISPAALRILQDYEWPGNIRELENVIQSAIIQAEHEQILPTDLPASLHSTSIEPEEVDISIAGRFERLLRDYKIKLAIKALEEHEGNKTLAAKSLDISRAYLYRLLSQHEETRHVA